MKHSNTTRTNCRNPSPPVRRRGLKPLARETFAVIFIVASRAEAWIETNVV